MLITKWVESQMIQQCFEAIKQKWILKITKWLKHINLINKYIAILNILCVCIFAISRHFDLGLVFPFFSLRLFEKLAEDIIYFIYKIHNERFGSMARSFIDRSTISYEKDSQVKINCWSIVDGLVFIFSMKKMFSLLNEIAYHYTIPESFKS
jgi:hypothetical protein